MKTAVENHRGDPDVVFLFVNSWERVEDWKSNAAEFIKANDYPFRVLLDTDNKVIESFKVEGIPTKFFIDREGRIRFKNIGFGGNTDQMVEEIGLIIEMLK